MGSVSDLKIVFFGEYSGASTVYRTCLVNYNRPGVVKTATRRKLSTQRLDYVVDLQWK